ncbi:MAG: Ig-like domain-containing protein [Actinomycetota bacterium]
MIKKLFVAAVAATALASFAAPALAQTGGNTSLSGVSNGAVIAGTVTLRGVATANAGSNVRHLEISIDGTRVASQDYDGVKESAAIDYTWNTRNGKNAEYAVKVYATFSGGGSSTSTANVKVANDPATPTGVSAKFDGNNIIVSWNPNPEPDIIGYRVERDGNPIGTAYNTSLADNPGAGTYSYRVIAIRYSPVGDKTSAPSASVSATVPASSGGSGSSSGGGYYQGDSDSGGYYSGGGSNSGGYYAGNGKNSGSGVAGYNGGKKNGGSAKKNRKGGGGGNPWGGFSYTGSRMIGSLGIPNLTLPGSRGALSPSAQDGLDWGDYDPTLPYDLSGQQGGAFPEEFLGGRGLAAMNEYTIIPPDSLRWVAAGIWFIVAAALLKFVERRLATAEAAASVAVEVPADGASDSEAQAVAEPTDATAPTKRSLKELLDDEPLPAASLTEEATAETSTDEAPEAGTEAEKTERHLEVVKDDAAA